ncbi:MAG: 3-deoxy-D-manno-octulosonic acid transferase [Rhodospirillales bacterium]|nr:3-deoxy-D-manno-octulosonic acid transferase [Rhodospirillales bacterium]
MAERCGFAGRPRPPGPLLWIHAASVGETRSVLGLVAHLTGTRPDLGLLFTTGTLTSARLLDDLVRDGRLSGRVIHQFVPFDVPAWVERFLGHWRPDAAIWVESELWPGLIGAAQARQLPMALINARMSARSFRRWLRLSSLMRPPLDAFAPCLAQSEGDALRLRALGAAQAACVGNLKYDGAPLAADPAELDRLRAAIGDRPVWLAASTHPGEEEVIADAHVALARRYPRLLAIIAPRHAERGAAITAALAARGLRVGRRAAGAAPDAATDVYIADTMGELGLFYRLARLAFIGGSLVPHGGQNPIEAARLGCALVFGTHMTNFREIADALIAAGGAIPVADAAGLIDAASGLLNDAEARARVATAAARVAAEGQGALGRVIEALTPLLARLPAAGNARASA